MIDAARQVFRRRGRLIVFWIVLGIVSFLVGRLLARERLITGGELSLPLDDGFIYLQYARAIAEGHPFVYTPGNAPTTGATSLWYPLLLLPPHLLHLSPEVCIGWVLFLGAAGLIASALLVARLGRELGGPIGSVLALAFFLMNPLLLWGYMSGMEIPLYGTILLATSLAYLRERREGLFPTLRWWILGLAGARPEGALLCLVFGLIILWDRLRASRTPGGPPPLSPFLLWPFVAGIIPFVVNFVVSGSFESTSSQAKSILAEPYAEARWTYLRQLPVIWVDIGKVYVSMLQLDPSDQMHVPVALASGAGLLFLVALMIRPRERPWRNGAPLLAIVAAGIVLNSIPVFWRVHLYRYQQGLFPLVLCLIASGWGRLAWLAWDRWPRGLAIATGAAALTIPLACCLPLLFAEGKRLPLFYGQNCENILHQQVDVGRWIDRNLPKGAIVGINDAGAIAYYGKRNTVDMVGITTAGFAQIYRAGIGCLFEHLRRMPAERAPTYFAIYPSWFPHLGASGILGPEAYRAHLMVNTICGDADKVVYPASWVDARGADLPALHTEAIEGKRLVDSIDLAWLEDERRHEWGTRLEARDVLRAYTYADRPSRPLTDGGRIIRDYQRIGGRIVQNIERFRATVSPGVDLLLIMRTDAWYGSRLLVSVDGHPAGEWTIPASQTAWVEPTFKVAGSYLIRGRPEFEISRDGSPGNYAPFHYWFYQ